MRNSSWLSYGTPCSTWSSLPWERQLIALFSGGFPNQFLHDVLSSWFDGGHPFHSTRLHLSHVFCSFTITGCWAHSFKIRKKYGYYSSFTRPATCTYGLQSIFTVATATSFSTAEVRNENRIKCIRKSSLWMKEQELNGETSCSSSSLPLSFSVFIQH